MLDPGDFDTFAMLQRRGEGRDAAGQPLGWVDVSPVWLDMRHPGGLETIRAGAVTSAVNCSARMHWMPGVTAAMRLVMAEGGTVYDIKAVLPKPGSHLDLVCEVVQ